MESWGYPSEGKGQFFPDEVDIPIDVLLTSAKALFEWDDTDFCNSERDGILSPGEAVESFDFFEMGSPDYFQSSFENNGCLDASSCELDCDFSKLLDAAGQEESPLEHSISFRKSKSPDSSLIDLKLGILDDFTDVQYTKLEEEGSNGSLTCQTAPRERDQTAMVFHQAPICQVYGCNIDLSSLKDYHKRHKVCDVHSKAAKVVVNGIEQRFCQQCSRFQGLSEFDDSKRSCRRRLAGHNERRRKSEFDNFSGRSRKLIHLYHGSKHPGISLLRKSQGGFFYPEKHEQLHHSEGCKNPPKKFDLLSRSFINGNGKRLSPEIDSSGTENYNSYGSASAIHVNSSCALSLLSLQSQGLSSYTAGDSIANTVNYSQGISAYPNDLQNSHNPFMASSTDDSYFQGLNSTKVDHHSHLSNFSISPEHGCTVNLLQLSTNLQRVEQQRQYVLGKQGMRTLVASPAFNWGSIQ